MEGPIGYPRHDDGVGMIASTIANGNRDSKKRNKPYQPDEFKVRYQRKEPEAQSPAHMKSVAKSLTIAMGGKVVDKHGNVISKN
jgi:hypothetical protein